MIRLAGMLALVLVLVAIANTTPLDDYVNMPDPTYAWSINKTITHLDYTAYMIRLTSQTWLNASCSDRSVWEHWLVVCVPNVMKTQTAIIYVDGGTITDGVPSSIYPPVEMVCMMEGAMGAHLQDIPNEPIIFENDGVKRSEDALIAYTWSHFFNDTTDPYWLARMPMTKATVKAMDTLQALGEKLGKPVNDFLISGASKRGWTTWTTGAVDKRVRAMVPIVMPILNMVPNMNHHYQAYGGWSFALDDYLRLNLMSYLNQPVFELMGSIIDPYSYATRLTMPKYIICATGDEFFLPDSAQFFLGGLVGEKQLRMLPNAEHSLAGHDLDLTSAIIAFFHAVAHNITFPELEWNAQFQGNDSVTITVNSTLQPIAAKLWYATTISTVRRDFRLIVCYDTNNPACIQPVIWVDKDLDNTGPPGTYSYTTTVQSPSDGWRGSFIELEYKVDGTPATFKSTTETFITPNYMPYPPCGDHCQ